MKEEPDIREDYFYWLADQVSSHNRYYQSLRVLFHMEFLDLVDNDVNRIDDGLLVRERYLNERRIDENELIGPCSMLEMLIGLLERIQWEMTDEVNDNSLERWFSEVMKNIGLDQYEDDRGKIFQTVKDVRDRKYDRNGKGGFFPLNNPIRDQRGVELWYQMNSYLIEKYP